jgi:thiosulfate/3-mercaptopyruvate sulfurtransferase
LLVSTDWVDEHRSDDNVRIVECDEDLLLYQQGHIREAVRIDWQTDLQDQTIRDYLSTDSFAELCVSKGISNDTTAVFYSDKNNWWACYALWAFKFYGHEKCLIMDGGRRRWELDNREFVREPQPD